MGQHFAIRFIKYNNQLIYWYYKYFWSFSNVQLKKFETNKQITYAIHDVILILHFDFDIFQNMKSSMYTQPLVLIATTMTFSKTVLYFLMSSPVCFGDMYFTGISWLKFVFLFIVPSGFWVVFPLFCMISISLQLAHTIQSKHKSN